MSRRNQYVEFIGLDPSKRLVKPIADSYATAIDIKTSISNILQEEELLPERSGLDVVLIKDIDDWASLHLFNIFRDGTDNYGLTYRSASLTATSLKRIVDVMFKNLRIENCVALMKTALDTPIVLLSDLVAEFDPKSVTLIDGDRVLIRSSSFATVNLEITKIII